MIRLLSSESPPPCPEPRLGCRIETILDCYAELGAGCYRSEEGGVLCLFGTTLLLSGRCDSHELAEFASLLGATRIEGLDDCFAPPRGWQCEAYPMLARSPAAPVPKTADAADASDQMRTVFRLLCEGDARFSAEAEYLPWLSDLTRRQNRGCAKVYLLDGTATACLSAIGGGYAWLSSVAVSPLTRGRGVGGRLLTAVASDCSARGLVLVTAAQNAGLLSFYQRTGFVPTDRSLLIATAK